MCVFKIQKWKWIKSSKLPWSIVRWVHTIVQLPYHTIVQTEKCHESNHIYSRRRNPTYIVVSLSDWHYVCYHIGIKKNSKKKKKQQLDIIKRKSPRLAKSVCKGLANCGPRVESSPIACFCVLWELIMVFIIFQWLRKRSTGEYCFVTHDHDRNWLFSAPK